VITRVRKAGTEAMRLKGASVAKEEAKTTAVLSQMARGGALPYDALANIHQQIGRLLETMAKQRKQQ
jgi:hypothetical protein